MRSGVEQVSLTLSQYRRPSRSETADLNHSNSGFRPTGSDRERTSLWCVRSTSVRESIGSSPSVPLLCGALADIVCPLDQSGVLVDVVYRVRLKNNRTRRD